MSLFDIMDEITAKQVTKTEFGENRILGVMTGTVTDNYEKKMQGKVRVQIPVRDENANILKWARVAMPSSGDKWGHYFLPEAGDQVLLAFEEGNIEKPYVIGCIPKDNSRLLSSSADEHNQYKKIQTRHGSVIAFLDSKDSEEGDKDKILVQTAKELHSLELDNAKNQITISDKDEKNAVVIQTEKGKMTVKAEKKLVIQVGDSIEITMNGENGTIDVKCSTLKEQAGKALKLETDGNGSLKASAGLSLEGGSQAKLSSGGQTALDGSLIKIG
ncbi:MAG: hypothetical protein HFI70_12830 [Lachnospiraceae bacterium]|nr:hypothetical protein [Lachnospiraceae bacterium]